MQCGAVVAAVRSCRLVGADAGGGVNPLDNLLEQKLAEELSFAAEEELERLAVVGSAARGGEGCGRGDERAGGLLPGGAAGASGHEGG